MKLVVAFSCVVLLTACAGMKTASSVAPPVAVNGFAAWQDFRLPGKEMTRYQALVMDGVPVVHAQSSSAASMFRRPVGIAAADIGRLSFEWRVDGLIDTADLTDADAADSPVRIVLAFDGDHGKLSAKNRMMFELAEAVTGEPPPYATLMYVWDNKLPLETVLPGGRSDRIRKIVVESGPAHTRTWRHHQRDIAADFRRAFGEAPGALIGVALLTDTDNTHSVTEAFYRGIELRDASGKQR